MTTPSNTTLTEDEHGEMARAQHGISSSTQAIHDVMNAYMQRNVGRTVVKEYEIRELMERLRDEGQKLVQHTARGIELLDLADQRRGA